MHAFELAATGDNANMRGKPASRARILCFQLVFSTLFLCYSAAHERKLTELRQKLDAQTLKNLRGDTELLGWLDTENGDVEKVSVIRSFRLKTWLPYGASWTNFRFFFMDTGSQAMHQ